MLLSHSTSSTSLSTNSNLYIDNATGTGSWNVGLQRVMATTAIVTHASTTTYYMLLQVNFGTANRVQFNNGTGSFQAIRMA
jgi:hypothetical protein